MAAVVIGLAAASVPLAAQVVAPAVGTVTIEKAVGATVVTNVLNQVSLPTINPGISIPSANVAPTANVGSTANAAPSANGGAPGQPSNVPSQTTSQVAGSGQNNLITVTGGGDTVVVSDTTISLRVIPVAVVLDLGGQIGDVLAGQPEGPMMIIAQFN